MNDFHSDLACLTAKISQNLILDHPVPPRLGDLLQYMGSNKLLLQKKKEDDFAINEVNQLSDAARDYLNALQVEKFYNCRFCYHKNKELRCAFHKKYIFDKDMKENHDEYVTFLNSEMGIISFVELYYSYLCVPFWSHTAKMIFRDLTNFSSVKQLLTHYNYECGDDADKPCVETMDFD